MTQKDFFAMLRAPLTNTRWSWGAVRNDGAVVLRVWKDNVRTHDGREYVRIWKQPIGSLASSDHGRRERLEHVGLLRGGARCYLIMCEAADTAAKPRRVRNFNAHELFPGGALKEVDGDWWIELLPAVPVGEVAEGQGGR